ncbi:hypothetical protein C1I98_08960 [Spongiactinospora gelatinilytica]|uniref:DUF6966 domain-containing protein n=1 Tax=Spongiactinospora gelatinilytica TaxID=2666298 RepID=A0A2W2HI41_9ACTN|nr:hypothetical protein [Spongiactinospora gelatinilytica]PZG51345.1 hypothetical protein C1I98_08960 [Spongiactinospora gelatinilytica]
MSALLNETGEPGLAREPAGLAAAVRVSGPTQTSVRRSSGKILRMYGGMGSLQDIVLQNAAGVLPENAEFDRLRRALFALARSGLC